MKKLLRLFRRRRWPVVAYWKGGILRGKIKLPVRHEWCTQIGMRVTARTEGCIVEERTFDHTFDGFKFELDGEDCYAPMNVPKGWSIHPVQPRASVSQDCEDEEEEDEESLSRRIRGWVTRFVRASVDSLRMETDRKIAEANRRFDERVAHMIAESKERFEQHIEFVEGAPQVSGSCDHHWKQSSVEPTMHGSKFLMWCEQCGGAEYVVLSDQQLAAGRSPEDALNDKYKRSGS